MGNITTDFITATKKIHADVRAVLGALRLIGNDVKAIHDQYGSENNQSESGEKHRGAGSVHPAKERSNTHEAKQYALDKLRFRLEKKAFCVGQWTVVILAIYTALTGFQACHTKRAADAAIAATDIANRQITETANNFKGDQRAWVAVQSMAMRLPEDPEKPIVFQAAVVNLGKTFAKHAMCAFSVLFSRHERDIAAYANNRDKNVAVTDLDASPSIEVLPPNIPYALNLTTMGRQWNRRMLISDLNQGKVFIYFFGHIDYQDVFGTNHQTTFCGIYNPAAKAFDSCPTYNSAD